MIRTYAYRLYPSKTQERLLFQTLETCRRFYNACLEERVTAWKQEQRSINKYEQMRKVKVEKAEEAGRQVIFVDPAYTSKTCSACRIVIEELKLSHRWIDCTCGLSIDRDVNAAVNILNRAGYACRMLTHANGQSVVREAARL